MTSGHVIILFTISTCNLYAFQSQFTDLYWSLNSDIRGWTFVVKFKRAFPFFGRKSKFGVFNVSFGSVDFWPSRSEVDLTSCFKFVISSKFEEKILTSRVRTRRIFTPHDGPTTPSTMPTILPNEIATVCFVDAGRNKLRRCHRASNVGSEVTSASPEVANHVANDAEDEPPMRGRESRWCQSQLKYGYDC
jgi:hypothetical protein